MSSYERLEQPAATSVQPNVLYQIDGRIDTIKLVDGDYTEHYNKLGRLLTGRGREKQSLETAAAAGTLWECREVP